MGKILFMLSALLCTGYLVSAQDTARISKTANIQEVTVTAGKFEQKQSETGKVVSIITAEELKKSSGKSLGQVLNEQPGITVGQSAGPLGANQSVYLRGANDNYTAILIDGVPVYDPSQISSHFDLNQIPLSIISRIEIIRGGAATLYSSGAVAGVINIITKKGDEKPFNFTAGLNVGSYNTFEEQMGINGRKNKWDYTVNFDQTNSGGFSSALDSTGHAGFDKDGFQRSTVNFNIGYQVSRQFQFRPFIIYTHEKGDLDQAAFTDDKDYYYTTNDFRTGFNARYQLGSRGELHLVYSFDNVHRNYRNDTLDHSDYLYTNNYSLVHQAEAYINYTFNPQWEIVAGMDYRFNKIDIHSLSISAYGPYESDLSKDSTHISLASAYASLFFKSPSGFHFEAGGRLNHHSLYGNNATFTINPFYLVRNKYKIYASAASAFNIPSLYQLFTPTFGNRSLEPEKSIDYELGAELPLSGRFYTRISGFVRNIRHVIAYTSRYINFDKQRDKGGELEVNYSPVPSLKLAGYYAYVSGKINTQSTATKMDTAYNNLYKKPRNSFGFSADYQVIPSVTVRANLKYTGRRMDIFFNDITSTQEHWWLKPYILLNCYIAYSWKQKLNFFVNLQNITGSHYTETIGYTVKGFNATTGVSLTL